MTTTITPYTTTPSRQSPSTFSADRDTRLAEEASRILQMNALATELNALAAAMTLNATTSTSTTSLAIGTGSKSLTVGTSKSYWPGQAIQIAYDSSNWMHGIVTSYNSETGAIVVNVTNSSGSGTYTAWTITLSGPIALSGLTAVVAELNYLAGVAAGTVTESKALVVDANKRLDTLVIADGGLKLGTGAGTAVTALATELNILHGATLSTTELNYVDGVTSAIQTQLNAKAPIPTGTSGVGLWGNMTYSGSSSVLPSGGTWAYSGSNHGTGFAGVAAGGTTIWSGEANNFFGFWWRIA